MKFYIIFQTLPRLYLPFENCPKETGVKICDIDPMDENGRREARQQSGALPLLMYNMYDRGRLSVIESVRG